MSENVALQKEIEGLATACIKTAETSFGLKLEYDEASLLRVDQVLVDAWHNRVPAMLDQMVLIWGAYIGECLRRLEGGHWVQSDEYGTHLCDVGASGVKIMPFNRIRARFEVGMEESITFYYRGLCEVIEEAGGRMEGR